MKKFLFTLLFLLMSTSYAKAQSPFDLIYHSIPVSPTIDIVEEIKQIGANLQTTISQSKKIIMAMKTDVSSIQSAITSTFNKIKSGAILDILGNPGQAKSGFLYHSKYRDPFQQQSTKPIRYGRNTTILNV